ncbi:hypothetical protein GCM10009765_45040 [Fodinicola feengrottensis]|uniref:Uncharacterized protein n=1 Tax=Fodinicola feengrottensis TaxID=435914 RepID=A0ABN2HMW9_9ACTN
MIPDFPRPVTTTRPALPAISSTTAANRPFSRSSSAATAAASDRIAARAAAMLGGTAGSAGCSEVGCTVPASKLGEKSIAQTVWDGLASVNAFDRTGVQSYPPQPALAVRSN